MYQSTFTDKTLECADCGQQFNHSAQDQQFYAERQFSEPRRCPTCRAVRKAARGDSGGSYSGGGAGSYSEGGYGQREMFTATCDSCGGQARVPFRPTGSAGLLQRLLQHPPLDRCGQSAASEHHEPVERSTGSSHVRGH